MRAAIYHGKEDLRIEQIPERECGPGQVKVAPAYCGICGTDIHEWAAGATFAPPLGKPHAITNEVVPIGFGHEFSGIVKEVGADVKEFRPGQHVVVKPIINCFDCRACKLDADSACEKVGFIGLSGWGGGLAESVVLEKHMVYDFPENLPLEYGALVEPLAVGWHAASMSGLQRGQNALVMGGGPIGQSVLVACLAIGAKNIVVAEVSKSRQSFAKHFGATAVLDPTKEDVATRAREVCGGLAPDVVFDCAGVPASLTAACEAVKPRGCVLNVAIWEKPIPFQPNSLTFKEARLQAVLAYNGGDYDAVIKAMKQGSIDPKGMITKTIKLEDVVEEGIKTLLKDRENHVKIMVDIHA